MERSRWDTTKIVFDPAEAKEAGQVAGRARYLITRLCADTAHGPLCPVDRRDELKEAIAEARELVEDFNMKATFTRVDLNVICGEVVADDVEAARALFSETERFLAQMQDGLKDLDVKKVRADCVRLLDIGQMLSPEANAMMAVAVNAARSACKRIVAAGEQAAIEIDQRTIDMIGLARNSFLDFGMDDDVEIESVHTARALDFEADESNIVFPLTEADEGAVSKQSVQKVGGLVMKATLSNSTQKIGESTCHVIRQHTPRQTVAQRMAEVRKATARIDALLAAKKVKVKFGKQGGVVFIGIPDEDPRRD